MKNIVKITLTILIMLAVCGCTANIPVNDNAGIHKVMSSTEIFAETLLKNTSDKMIESDFISLQYDNGTVMLEVDAALDKDYSVDLISGKLVPSVIDQQLIINELVSSDNQVQSTTQKYGSEATVISIDTQDGNTQNLRISPYGFSFSNIKLIKETYTDGQRVNNEKPILTEGEAITKITSSIGSITDFDISIKNINVLKSSITNELFYEILFSQKLGDIAFETTSSSSPNMIKILGSAIIGDRGIGMISCSVFFNAYDTFKIERYLQIQDALQLLKSYVDKYYNFADYLLINEVEINYIAKVMRSDQIMFYPVWVFTINKDVSKAEYPLSGGIIINAVTGQIETLD